MENIINELGNTGLIPVVVIKNEEIVDDLASALLNGNLNAIEITLRTEQGLIAIDRIKKKFPDMLVGAGTVLSVEQANQAVNYGAEFIVSPGFDQAIVEWCLKREIPVIPGCVTPTEITKALGYGLRVLKYFPANLYGGVKGCQALSGPFRSVSFIPTGGVSMDNLHEFVDKQYIHAVGGSWLCPSKRLESKRFSEVTTMVVRSIEVMLGFKVISIDLPKNDNMNPSSLLGEVEKYLYPLISSKEIEDQSVIEFSTQDIERPQINFTTNNINRTRYYLGKLGLLQNKDEYSKNRSSKNIRIQFDQEINIEL